MCKIRICGIAALAAIGVWCCAPPAGSPAAPDLTVSVTTASSGTLALTDPWPFSVVVKNVGAAAAAATTLRYRISSDAVPAGPDIVISVAVPKLAVGASFTDPYSGLIGDRGLTYPGTNHLTITVDPLGTLPDSDRTNDSTSAVLPLKYDRVVIETYDPAGAGGSGYTAMELFRPDDLTTPIATGIPGSDGFASIDYLPDHTAVLDLGDYYVKVYEDPVQGSDNAEAYAIRILLVPSSDYSGQTSDTWASSSFSGWVIDDTGSAPDVKPGGYLMRYYPGPGYDWVKVTLP